MNDRLIVIGSSLGGLEACKVIFSKIPSTFHIPIALVLHRDENSSSDLIINILKKDSHLIFIEAEDKMLVNDSICYIAPAGYHLLIDGDHFALSAEGKINYSRPSIDALFNSAADAYQSNLIAILMTGNSIDGSRGLKTVKERGGITIVQDPKEAKASTMPESGIAIADPDFVLPLTCIVSMLLKLAIGNYIDK